MLALIAIALSLLSLGVSGYTIKKLHDGVFIVR